MGRQQARVEPRTAPSPPAALEGGGTGRANMYQGEGREAQPSRLGLWALPAATPMAFVFFAVPF